MLEYYASITVNFIEAHPYWGQFFTFFIAFLESLAIIGTVIPGSVTMTAIGALVGAAVFPPVLTIAMATVGALTGDWLGYWFGKYYANEIREFKIFKPYQKWFDSGENFFHKHGGKSVIIGRFFGPVRSFIPMIAGVLQMHPGRFTIAVIPAAILWAFAYMLPGILLGALSLEMPAGMATKFILWALLGIFLMWLFTVTVKLFFQTAWGIFDTKTQNLWFWMRGNNRFVWLTRLLSDPKEPNRHRQLALLLIIFLSSISLMILLDNVIHGGYLTYFNKPISYLLMSIRTPTIYKMMIVITTLGNTSVILTIAGLLAIVFASFKFWRTCFHWVLNIGLIAVSAKMFKHFFYFERPMPINAESSFPSGHTCLTFGILGFLAVIIGTHLPRDKKKIPYAIVGYITLAIAFSRLYLGAHWLTDVIGSILLALICISITSISYRRHYLKPFPIVKVSIITGSIIAAVWAIYAVIYFNASVDEYQITFPEKTISTKSWWEKISTEIPKYRLNRYGNPKIPLNIQWKANLADIKHNLEKKAWKEYPAGGDIKSTISRLSEEQSGIRLPLLSQLYLNKPPILVMIKFNGNNEPIMKLQIWNSNIKLDSGNELLIGTVSEYLTPAKYFSAERKLQKTEFIDVTSEFTKDIENYQFKKVTVEITHQKSMLQWNGVILKISTPRS